MCLCYCPATAMESSYSSRFAIRESRVVGTRRHSAVVRVTHWVTTASFGGLLVSGVAILLAHPRLYWGETGSVGTPSLVDLPLPFIVEGQTGWGRSLHFLSGWVCFLTGLIYVVAGVVTQHFRRDLLPTRVDLVWPSLRDAIATHLRLKRSAQDSYNVLQRLAYLAVIFVLFPLMILTGLAMSPAIAAVVPFVVTVFGGQQSARTLHFFTAALLVVFVFVHIAMICVAGFRHRVWSMITGRGSTEKEFS